MCVIKSTETRSLHVIRFRTRDDEINSRRVIIKINSVVNIQLGFLRKLLIETDDRQVNFFYFVKKNLY